VRTPADRVGDYTQAIMDLGATLCTRSKPACALCPVQGDCEALALGDVARFPGRKPKKEKPRRATTMLLAVADGAVYLERRPASGIWGGLWSLPEVSDVDDWCAERLQAEAVSTESWGTLRHSFSHYDLDIAPVVVRIDVVSSKVADYDDSTWYRPGDAPPGGIAAPVMRLIETLRNTDELRNHG
jgi:A/G-specific adenine glycosylase